MNLAEELVRNPTAVSSTMGIPLFSYDLAETVTVGVSSILAVEVQSVSPDSCFLGVEWENPGEVFLGANGQYYSYSEIGVRRVTVGTLSPCGVSVFHFYANVENVSSDASIILELPSTPSQIAWNTTPPAATEIDDVSGLESQMIGSRIFLFQSKPNPFNPQTTIAFELPKHETVTLRVFDMAGRLVRELISSEPHTPGRHEVVWSGRDDTGRQVASGTYFYRLEAGSYSETKRMVLIK